MATQKFLSVGQIPGTQDEKIAVVVSVGAADGGRIPALRADGRLDQSLMPLALDVLVGEALAAGDFINLYGEGGVMKVRKASVAQGRPATGFVRAAYAADSMAAVYTEGVNDQIPNTANHTPEDLMGKELCLHETVDGGFATVVPAVGFVQPLGRVISVTPTLISMDFEPKTIVHLV